MKNWKKVFSEFYDKNESGGSSRWLVAPNIVEMFIENLLQEVPCCGHGCCCKMKDCKCCAYGHTVSSFFPERRENDWWCRLCNHKLTSKQRKRWDEELLRSEAMKKIRDPKTKEKFIQYLIDNPELRFWQALRNFSGYRFIMGVKKDGESEDTFHIEADEEL